jgi:hypothetical protein
MTTGKKVFIPTLTDIVDFDEVPSQTSTINHASEAEKAAFVQPYSDIRSCADDIWAALEPDLKNIMRDAILGLFEQQQTDWLEHVRTKMHPLLMQAIESQLTRINTQNASFEK